MLTLDAKIHACFPVLKDSVLFVFSFSHCSNLGFMW